jgi:hypothetical protein
MEQFAKLIDVQCTTQNLQRLLYEAIVFGPPSHYLTGDFADLVPMDPVTVRRLISEGLIQAEPHPTLKVGGYSAHWILACQLPQCRHRIARRRPSNGENAE